MKYRVLPLGYKRENGEIVIDATEAEIVKGIFDEYCNGSPLSALIEALNAKDTIFKESAAEWNKGRLHHILVDERYLGNETFPRIIDKETYEKVHSIMESKCVSKRQIPPEIEYLKGKVYCEKCGGKFKRVYDSNNKERWVCENGCKFGGRPTDRTLLDSIQKILNKVVENPTILYQFDKCVTGYMRTPGIMRLTNEIARIGDKAMPSFNTVKTLLFQLASTKFSACKEDKSVYTDYILSEIKSALGRGGADVEFMRNAVSKIVIKGKSEYAVLFLNGVEISDKEDELNAS